MTKRKTIQQVFDLAIETGAYDFDNRYMCHAIDTLAVQGLIADHESIKVKTAINKYIGQVIYEDGSKVISLHSALSIRKIPNDFYDRLAIYKDWANRPRLSARKIREASKNDC